MCEAIGLYLPLSNRAIVTIYRPTGCELVHFSKAINRVSNWLTALETKYSVTPIVRVNGDINFPSIESWDSMEILTFLDKLHEREDREVHIGAATLQTRYYVT